MSFSIKDFKIIKKLATGSFSSVYKVLRISDEKNYAMKKVKIQHLKEKEKQNALNEIRILASINNKNVIAYKDAFFDESDSCLCIIMELAEEGDISKKIEDHKKLKYMHNNHNF